MPGRSAGWHDRFQFVSLAETQRRIGQGCNRRPCVSITFDDGYADNCRQAIPLLVHERIPCTYFVTVGNVLDRRPFPHDLADRPSLRSQQRRSSFGRWPPPASRSPPTATRTPTWRAIGDPGLLHYEVVAAKEDLEKLLAGRSATSPSPTDSRPTSAPAAFELARQAGYAGVCSAYGGFNFPGDDPFHLQRIAVDNAMIRLKNWATLDPRKLRTPRFEYGGRRRSAMSPRRQSLVAKPQAAFQLLQRPDPQSPIPNPPIPNP